MRGFIRKLVPAFLLNYYRNSRKKKKNSQLSKDKEEGKIISKDSLIHQLKAIGIEKGDTLLVHSSLSKIGYIENGAQDLVEALLEVVGSNGHILMPNSPNATLQLDYIRQLNIFDVANAKSKLGATSEYFRLLPNAKRSAHPTEPVSCIGPNSSYFVDDHFGNRTPYNQNSPFYRITEKNGKILYIGVTFDNAGTSLHILEDAVEDFGFPVYHDEEFEVNVLFNNGSTEKMRTLVHNPIQSAKRKCDGLIPLFENKGVLRKVKIGQADSLLVDAKGMYDVMLDQYLKRGVTMYTPNGH